MNKDIFPRVSLKVMVNKHILLIVALFLCLTSHVWATNWYVSQGGGGTKDGKTAANAWSLASLNSTGWSSMSAGDTLYIIGIVNGIAFNVKKSGITNSYFTIAGYDSTSGFDQTYHKDSTLSWSYNSSTGVYSLSKPAPISTSIGGFAEMAIGDSPANWTMITKGTAVPDANTAAGTAYYDGSVLYWKPLNGTIAGKTLLVGCINSWYINGQNWLKVENLRFYGGPIFFGYTASQHVWLDNITVDGMGGGTLIMLGQSTHVRLSNSTIKNGIDGLWNNGQTAPVDSYVTIDHNVFTNFKGGNDSHCIGLYNGGQRWTIEYNDLSYANTGITAYGEFINNNIIRYNYIHNMEGSRANGVGYSRGYGIGFEGNILSGETRTGNYVYGNVVSHCTGVSGGMPAWGIHAKFTDANNYIYNNTVYDCSPNYYLSSITVGGVAKPAAVTFKNNISYEPNNSSPGYQKHITVTSSVASNANFAMDYNLYYPDAGTLFQYAGCSYNFSNWRAKSQMDTHSPIPSEPLFTNASGSYARSLDFILQNTSPAVNKGDNAAWSGKPDIYYLTGSTAITDSAGKIVAPGGIVNIGACEATPALSKTSSTINVPGNLRIAN